MKSPKNKRYERYEFSSSPWTQNLTQRDLADLLGFKKDRLEALIRDKERFTRREEKLIGTKLRNLAVPTGKLRSVHERLKYHLNKIKQPDYLYSPRKGRSQRDNAERHIDQSRFISLDIKQFYPSTTDEHVFRWAYYTAGLRPDVAGMLTKLVVIDNKMPFGSPISPVLTTLIHRPMFDEIYSVCQERGLVMSLWVDDLTISGSFVRGEIIELVRAIIRHCGLQTHKIYFRDVSRPVVITGVPIFDGRVCSPRALHQRVQDGYLALRSNLTGFERAHAIDSLRSALGSQRYHVGASSEEGRLIANRMYVLRRRRALLDTSVATMPATTTESIELPTPSATTSLPWD